jgi:pilus assembly protein Flp/PilA
MLKLAAKLNLFVNRLRDEEEGATAVEYALMVALIAVVIIAAVTLIGQESSETFQNVADNIGATN